MLLSLLTQATACRYQGGDVEIEKIEYDSRHVAPGSLFCCVVGTFSDGHEFAVEAVARGAVALVVEKKLKIDVPQVVVKNTRIAMAEMAAAFYGHPERELTLVGITGTNGKTTTTYMVKAIADRAGYQTGLIGTIRNMVGEKIIDTERTTPESVDLFRLLRQMRDAGVDLAVMEVSSHSLDQHRVHGLEFEVGEFTNLTQDHLDYHKTFENYIAAKKKLFAQSKHAVVNADDPYTKEMLDGFDIPVTTFGIRENADIYATDIDITTRGVLFDMGFPGGVTRINIPIPGLFSVFNAMGAVGVALALRISMEHIKMGLEDMQSVSGRLEPLQTGDLGFSVFVDYAHTPDALENVLKTVRGFAKGKIITVFGCGGDRDRAKRPIMGEVAGRFSDKLVVTSDNPRTEDPFAILEAIEEGVKKSGCSYTIIEQRRDAIRYALHYAKPDDVILIAGKGHENYQEINGVKHHFDDKEEVLELLNAMQNRR
ncbi:UDP-N-acetylmuramoyl-L-alanyl-D-glutamate--2,6-diaminopimelate ligase [Christensenellaceae bacterium OttesenSCG-928-L17]|nr:UDP-N-acetylmuramoyl-L-alanyl-D-glutamate--2,6-diaminopimelate ligase [Christensenellaceae bacterium OttesenSCG-928-L17]